ncbi:DUF4652 domain-containing protein [Clostridium sp. ZS2-4]|uniref:DUF4652 domain-containing protein n=1 Tax=Clostridium sp. ZS2-4 TaxID=2987703 RepID=UPI00227B2855|nr:DUF4652 domain-containing protein [Clostridium sp. ZS2-4]MCY6354672.1 DUF4652 domain-containing protein [Clostridium sp. ZS2-4]
MKNEVTKYKEIACLMLSVVFISSIIAFTGCSKNKNQIENTKLSTDKNQIADSNDTDKKTQDENVKPNEENTKNEPVGDDKKDAGEDMSRTEENKVKFVKHQLAKSVEPEFGTPWKNSINKKLSVCIEGKGPDAEEEGIGKIYVRDLSTGVKWSLEIIEGENQNSPKSIEWIDDENIISIVGLGYGTVAMGGNVYKINVKTAETTLLYDTKSQKKQVISVKKVGNKLELQILVYDDEEFIKNHTEKKVIELK